jgi:MFS family permease
MLPNLSQLNFESNDEEHVGLFGAAALNINESNRSPYKSTHLHRGIRNGGQTTINRISSSIRQRITYFAYFTTVLGSFSQSVGTPTAILYTNYLVGNPNLSGLLVGSFNFAACITQVIEAFLLRCMPTRVVYVVACCFGLLGSILMIVALPMKSAVLLFAGRACSGFIAGSQLFLHLNTVNAEEPIERQEEIIRMDTLLAQISLFLTGIVSVFFLEFSTTKFENNESFNAANLPYFVPLTLFTVALIALATLWPHLPEWAFTRQHTHSVGRTNEPSVCAMWCALFPHLLTVVAACAIMGVKLFLIFIYQTSRWNQSLSSITILSSVIELGGVLTVTLDNYLKRIPIVSVALSSVAMLTIADWDQTWPPIWAFSIASVILTCTARVVYTEAVTETSKLIAQRPSMREVVQLALSLCWELGLGMGGFLIGIVDRKWITCVGVVVLLIVSVLWGKVVRCAV